jgi:ABC-2 type transport system permease protein
MSNVFAIAHKELRSYFASPIAYVVTGVFGLTFGFFYTAYLYGFVEMSMGNPGTGGGGPANVNQQMIRPVLQNAAVVLLFVLPMLTMRTYAEERRSGTIELLLTSPLTDVQIILGKFLGALALYAVMLAASATNVLWLFAFGRPEWGPILSGYLGLLLFGGAFIAIGLLISSLTSNQIVAGAVSFTLFLLLWIVDWVSSFTGPDVGNVLSYLSITSHLDEFLGGVLETKNIIYYLSFITFGLFLTAKAVDSQRWRG